MSDYVMRKTGLDQGPAAKPDYQFHYKGKAVGRCYLGSFGMSGDKWRWSIYTTAMKATDAPNDHIPIMGYADSRKEAADAFKASFEALREMGGVHDT